MARSSHAKRWSAWSGQPTKNPALLRGFSCCAGNEALGRLHLVGLQTLRALDDVEGNLLAFLQGLESGADDRAEMHEHVFTVFAADETEALGIVEPLHGAGLTLRHN